MGCCGRGGTKRGIVKMGTPTTIRRIQVKYDGPRTALTIRGSATGLLYSLFSTSKGVYLHSKDAAGLVTSGVDVNDLPQILQMKGFSRG